MGKTAPIGLIYTGPAKRPGETVALPEGWPASDHDEPNADVRAAKLASGMYAADKE